MRIQVLLCALLLSMAACSKKKSDKPPVAEAPVSDVTAVDTADAADDAVPLLALPDDANAVLPLDPKITTGKLDNGLTYYILPNSLPEKRAEFWMSIDAGSFHEDEDQLGLAHFLEHMAFNGTTSFPKNELIAKLEQLGVDFGAHLNASTSFDETIYKLRLPTDDSASVDLGLQILSEWISGISLDPEEYEKERGVVLAEKRSGDGPQMRLMQNLIRDALAGTRYANRLPIGQPEVLKKAPLAAIQRFYTDWYHPANAAVYVVGDIDAKDIEEKIKARFGAIPARESARKAPERKQPEGGAMKFLNLQDKELPLTAVGIGRFLPAAPLKSMADYRENYIDLMASTMLSKRMEEAQKQGKASFLAGGAAVAPMVRSLRIQAVLAMLDPGKVKEGTRDLLIELERARRHGFTGGEMERASKEMTTQLRSMARSAQDGKETSADLVEELTRYHLQEQAMPGRAMEYSLVSHFGGEVLAKDVNKVFASFFEDEGLVAASLGASEQPALGEAELEGMIAELATMAVPAYAEKPTDEKLIKSAPTAGSITKKSHDKAIDVHTWTLSNGATLHLKTTDFKSDEVLFRAFSFGGTQLVGDKNLAAIAQATQLVAGGGLGEFDMPALERALAGRDVQLSPTIDRDSEGLSGSAGSDDVETLLQLAHLYFTSPRKDAVAAGVIKDTLVASLKQQDKDPDHRFMSEFLGRMTNGDPRVQFMDHKAASRLDLEQSMALYQDRMHSAGDFHFYLVGDFELAEVEPLVTSYLASLPDTERRETRSDRVWPHNPKRTALTVRHGTQDRASIWLFYNQRREAATPNLEERLALEAFERAARMQILKIFREELGESYGAGVNADWGTTGTSLLVQLQSAPASAVAMQKRAEAEVSKLVAGSIEEEHFQNAKSAMLKADEDNLKKNSYWIGRLEKVQESGIAPSEVLERKAAIDALTLADVKATVAERIDAERPAVGLLLPKK